MFHVIEYRRLARAAALALATVLASASLAPAQTAAPVQAQDEAYTALIKKHLVDPRFTTELVDHMPASDTVPSPLKFFGRIPGTPGELTYAKDIERYYQELAKTSPRVKFWTVGKSEEGRDQVVIAIADEATLKDLDKYKAQLAALGDPRKTTPAEAKAIIKTAKPIYWITSGIHSPETGGPEMLIELAYRLAIEETPLVQNIRKNVITFITPVVEVDGREKIVDTYYYGKKTGKPKPPLVYWGKYVAHDNNRDGMGQYLKLTQNITAGVLEWHPTILHDLHEAQSYLYVSTGTGPYNPELDPVQSQEWWLLAETELTEMAKRKVPGVFTYGYYDGWVPNYLFWIANAHNSFGRFYEVQSYGPDVQKDLKLPVTATSREWYRQNPPLPSVDWGPRNNTNIQESALLIALDRVAKDREVYLDTYYVKSQHAVDGGKVDGGKTGAANAWIVPADQTARLNVADMINDVRRQGLEVSVADAAFTAGGVKVAPGDYVIRADQPYRTLADLYFSVQNYPAANPRPYDDTGWTMSYMRNVRMQTIHDPAVLKQPMTLLTADVAPKGVVAGGGKTILVNHTGDNELVTFRFKLKDVKMLAAETAFDAGGKHYAAGTFIIPDAPRAQVEKAVAELGLTAEAVDAAPTVKSHALTVPRIGYLHSWLRTQDEGWWRAALDHYGVPYTYLADTKARQGDLRKRFDVILYPTVGSSARDQVVGVAMNGDVAIPYKKSDLTPNLGVLDSADDIRGGLGADGLAELQKFVKAGGVLIGDGSTVEMLANYGVAAGVSVAAPPELYTKGALMRGVFTDQASPIAYGYGAKEMPVYFADAPVITVATPGQGGFGGGGGQGGGAGARYAQTITPNAVAAHVSPFPTPDQPAKPAAAPAEPVETAPPASRQGGAEPTQRPRTVMAFPAQADTILLSGMLEGGSALTRKALIVDVPDGKGHMVLFGLRPYWRWQTQGSYFLGFNAILNWDHLDAGMPPKPAPAKDAKDAPAKDAPAKPAD
ncbi:M14 family zinc carboxypeptidase [Phenylobacterium sp.]|uniref:M14 family zinc carboxypeptidase n=1 Tax=Phenylobacterium sp. TaxID=1871053 RepID=UPI002BDA102D|nr:M14 family zinc carboxypeptidase [Phenylobacterium sp.]HLZ76838.1 M14 family zinc carboxypeptidase [Phenylobacterium sp.]